MSGKTVTMLSERPLKTSIVSLCCMTSADQLSFVLFVLVQFVRNPKHFTYDYTHLVKRP